MSDDLGRIVASASKIPLTFTRMDCRRVKSYLGTIELGNAFRSGLSFLLRRADSFAYLNQL